MGVETAVFLNRFGFDGEHLPFPVDPQAKGVFRCENLPGGIRPGIVFCIPAPVHVRFCFSCANGLGI